MSNALPSSESLFKKGLQELSISCTAGQTKAFMFYLSELKKWNKAYSLTSLKTDEEIIIKHFLDSLLYLKALPEGAIRVLDVGSGAGFPGMPLKIVRPEIFLWLIEPSRKKAGFLRHMLKVLGLDTTEVIEKRIEDVGPLDVDAALTRALFTINDFYKKASHCVKDNGRLIVSKGPKVHQELRGIGAIKYDLLELPLPLASIKRFLVVMKKDRAQPTVLKTPRHIRKSDMSVCINAECRMRKSGCSGFEGCPGYKARG